MAQSTDQANQEASVRAEVARLPVGDRWFSKIFRALPTYNAVGCYASADTGEMRNIIFCNAIPEDGIQSLTHFGFDLINAAKTYLSMDAAEFQNLKTADTCTVLLGIRYPALRRAAIVKQMERNFLRPKFIPLSHPEIHAVLIIYRELTENGFRRNDEIIKYAEEVLSANVAGGSGVVPNTDNETSRGS